MTKKSLITDRIIDICVENISAGMSYNACAKAINIHPSTWQNWTNWGKQGRAPYSKWLVAIQAAEATLFKECLDAVKLSIKLGEVKSAYFLLQTRFADEGYGKSVSVRSKNENLNVNIDATPTVDEREKIRQDILTKLQPRGMYIEGGKQPISRIILPGNEEI